MASPLANYGIVVVLQFSACGICNLVLWELGYSVIDDLDIAFRSLMPGCLQKMQCMMWLPQATEPTMRSQMNCRSNIAWIDLRRPTNLAGHYRWKGFSWCAIKACYNVTLPKLKVLITRQTQGGVTRRFWDTEYRVVPPTPWLNENFWPRIFESIFRLSSPLSNLWASIFSVSWLL